MEKKRFILVGFDGANPEMVERFLPSLPNFKRLIAEGSWGPMLSTIPCDTPTNWTALATGATASTSGITGFAYHKPGQSLREEMRTSDYQKVRAAEFIWEAADRQGRKSLIVNYPFAWYSRDLKHGIIVGGDSLRGGQAMMCDNRCLCTSDRMDMVTGATHLKLRKDGDAYVGDVHFGPGKKVPRAALGEKGIRLQTIAGVKPRLRIEDASAQEIALLAPGEWSEYKPVNLAGEMGWVRFLLVHLSEDGSSLQLYHSMITRRDGWTKPDRYAPMLLEKCGPFQPGEETGGSLGRDRWAGPYEAEAMAEVLRETGRILISYGGRLAEMEPDWDHMYIQLHANDVINHMILGHLDSKFPLGTAESKRQAQRLIRENYLETDRLLGQAAALAEEDNALLVAVSDHSAVPTHTWVDTARPFMDKGWLHFDEEAKWDPTRSKIRKMINHSIYVNLKGRQPDGIVEPEEYESVRDEIISTLMNMRDPKTGACPIAVAARREDMDGVGGNGEGFGDVIYLMRPGYTNQPASEGKLLTREALQRLVVDADEGMETGYTHHARIQGNHHDYLPNAVYPGVCSNRAILLLHGPGIKKGHAVKSARTIDVTPTLSYWAGIEPPAQVEGHVLMDVFEH